MSSAIFLLLNFDRFVNNDDIRGFLCSGAIQKCRRITGRRGLKGSFWSNGHAYIHFFLLLCPAKSFLINRCWFEKTNCFSYWSLICVGFGLGIVYAPSFGILALYFDQRKTVATAACTIGIGVGMLIFPPMERLMIAHCTWRGASLILGALSLNMVPCAMLFTGHVVPKSAPSLAASADVTLFRKCSFYVMGINFFLMGAFNIFMIIAIRFVMDFRGVSKDDAPLLVSVQGELLSIL